MFANHANTIFKIHVVVCLLVVYELDGRQVKVRRDVLRLFVARRKLDGLGYVVDYGFVDDERLSIGSRTRRASAQEHPAEELGHVPQGSTLEESKLLAVNVLIFLQLRIEGFSVTSKREQSFRIVYSKLWDFSRFWKFAWRIFTFLSSNLYEGAVFYEDCSQSPNVAGLANFSTVVVSSRKHRIPRELEILRNRLFHVSVEFLESRHVFTEAQNLANTANLLEFLNFQVYGNRRICRNFLRTPAKSAKLYEISDVFEIARHRRIYRDHEIFPTARQFPEISVLARDRSIFQCHRNFPTSAPASSLRIPGICYREIGWNCSTRPDRRKGKATCAEPHVSPNHRK